MEAQQPQPPQPGEPGGPAMTPAVFQMDRVPDASELATLPEGMQIQTPYGTVDRASGKLSLSPEGKVKYQEAVVQARKKLGPTPFGDIPNAPPMPVRLGRYNVNPFTGQLVKL